MANFIPLKNYFFFCLDKLISQYNIQDPFLDVGCGIGDLSEYLARKGWSGTAFDFSAQSIRSAKKRLEGFPEIKVERKTLFQQTGKYKSIFLFDVLEHIENDTTALKKIEKLLDDQGMLILIVPFNPPEWRWDDDFYGHYHRYDIQDLKDKLTKNKLKTVVIWNGTFPVFWIMRRIYTSLWKPPIANASKESLTKESSMQNAWDIPIVANMIQRSDFIWRIIYKLQFGFFRNYLKGGHEIILLAVKENNKNFK